MTNPPPTKIATDGNAKVHIIDTLGDICHVLKSMTMAIIHLNNFANENVAKTDFLAIISNRFILHTC